MSTCFYGKGVLANTSGSDYNGVMKEEWIDIKKDPKHVARERAKAKDLRKSPWWKQQLSTGTCFYCGKQFNPDELTMDHKVPVVRGGKSTKSNCVPCCKPCNNEKKYLTPAEQIMAELEGNDPGPIPPSEKE